MTIHDVTMPQMGESLAEGTIVRWLKAAGETVAQDEPLFEITTDKVDTDVPAPASGVLKEILVAAGETVAVGQRVGTIEGTGDRGRPAEKAPTAVPAEEGGHFKSSHAPQLVAFRHREPPQAVAPSTGPGAARPTGRPAAHRSYSPAVLETVRQGGMALDALARLQGSGRGGRVTKKDVQRALAEGRPTPGASGAFAVAAPPPEYLYRPGPEDRRVAMSPVRRKIAHHMAWSVRISPHATAFAEVDMTGAARRLARARAESAESHPAYTAIVAAAAVRALSEFPVLNSSVVDDDVIFKPHVHLGVAVALTDPDELVVPVVHHAEDLSLAGLSRAIRDLADRARARRLTPQDVQGGTFTITNPGIFRGMTGTPILNQPQVAILGLGAIVKRPVVVDDAIAIRRIMSTALTFDHRAADGMMAFRFLDRLRELLETDEGGSP